MNKASLEGMYGYFDMVQKVTYEAMAQVPEGQLDFRPKPEMRTIRELLAHIFGTEAALTRAVITGQLRAEEATAAEHEGLKATTNAEMIAFAQRCHNEARRALEEATEEQLSGPVETFFGTFPGWQLFSFSYDEHWHHRGQLYTYLRLLGITPVFLYNYE